MPIGKVCQIHLAAREGVALITELHRPGNTPLTPQDIWLMTCNHSDGNTNAESICRSTLAGFRFRDQAGDAIDEERILVDMLALTERMADIVLSEEGDCDAFATRLQELEPLAVSVFARAKHLRTTLAEPELARVRARFDGVKVYFEQRDPERAKALNEKTGELAVRCQGNTSLEGVLGRLGLRWWR